ncbi:MAG: HipA family kinase [Streptosporangiaceae bacterium]
MLPEVTATRYVTPLREGGSLPGLMEADDLGTYVVKFRGAGQGRKALVAEVVSAHLARACGLLVPDLVAVDLDPGLAAGEPDQEIQDLLRASGGRNLGVDFLAGAVDFDAGVPDVTGELAGLIIWFDALVSNADRSWRNPNMLFWREDLYLIDHGATLTYQHRWEGANGAASRPYEVTDHALIGCAPLIDEADSALADRITAEVLRDAVAAVPDEWLEPEPGLERPALVRDAHVKQLTARLASREAWLAGIRQTAREPDLSRREPTAPARPFWLNASPRRRTDGTGGTTTPHYPPQHEPGGTTPGKPTEGGEVAR